MVYMSEAAASLDQSEVQTIPIREVLRHAAQSDAKNADALEVLKDL